MTYVLGTGTQTQVTSGVDNTVAQNVTRLANGNYIFTWYGGDTSNDPNYPAGWFWSGLHTQMFSATGQSIGAPVTIAETTGVDNYAATVSALADGGYLVLWNQQTDYDPVTLIPATTRIIAQRYDANGAAVAFTTGGGTGPVTLVGSDVSANQATTVLVNGNFVISWQTQSDSLTHLRTYDAGGHVIGSVDVASLTDEQQASMETLSDGTYLRYFIASAQAGQPPGAGFDIYVQHYAANGTTIGGSVVATTSVAGNQLTPHTAVFNGGYILTYSSPDASSSGILGQVYNNDGSKVGAEFQVNTYTNDRQTGPEIAVLADGNFVIAWRSNLEDGSGLGVYYQLFSAAGAKIGAETRIATETLGAQTYVRVEALIGGGFTAFWSGPDADGNYSNFQRTYLPESGSGTAGDDVINGSDNANTFTGLAGNDTMDGRGGNDNLDGGTGNDNLIGGLGDDTLKGGAGDDSLNGSIGADRMSGGSGNDTYYVENAGDKVFEFTTAGVDDGGRDRVVATFSYSLGTFVEDLYVSGVGSNGTGNALDNVIVGDVNTNVLRGLDGNDVLDEGNGGNDKLYGGAGNDTYVLHAKGRVYEDTVTGVDDGGIDTVISSGSYALGNFVENLTLVDAAVSATGNALNNVLRGNGLSNKLDGLTGADTMYGGGGDDYYYVDNAGDVVSEQTVDGVDDGGTDRVTSTVDFTLGAYLETLVLSGTDAISGTGNTLANTIIGNGAYNRISGLAGNDILTGGGGADDFVFAKFGAPNGNDHIKDFVSGSDRLVFKASDYGWAGGHVLTAGELSLTGVAVGPNKQFVYDPVTHQLYWDSNGANAGGSVAVVAFDNGAAPQLSDFVFESDSPVGTGLAIGTSLTYVARFVDKNGNVIASDGNNGWISLDAFYPSVSGFPGSFHDGYVSLNFGPDKASEPLLSVFGHQDGIGLEVEAYQTIGGTLQLVDQYLFENSKVVSQSAGVGDNGYSLAVGRFERDHYVRDGKGVLQSSSEFGWDLATQAKVNLSDHADFKADGSVAGGTVSGLSYVVRFFDSTGALIASDGTNGWVRSGGVSTAYSIDATGLPEATLSFSAGKLAVALGNALEQDSALSIEVEAYKTTASGQVSVDETLFKAAHITHQDVGLSGTDAPQDFLQFTYGQIEQTHTSLTSDGKVAGTTRAGWDYVTKSDVNLSDPGDFLPGDIAGNAPAARLTVGRFVDSGGKVLASEGTNGWMKLDNFSFDPSADNFGAVTAFPFTAQVSTVGSDKLGVALEQVQLANAHISFQVESLALIGGQYHLVDEYLFAGASTAASSFAAGGGDSLLLQTSAFTHNVISHDAKGGETGTTSTGWDIGTHAPVNLPDPADYLPGVDTAAAHTEALTTVVRFIGADGKSIVASDSGAGGWVSGTASLFISAGSGTGGGASISLTDDAALVALEAALLRGDKIGVDIETYRTSAAGLQLVDEYLIAKAAVTGVAIAASGGVSLDAGQYTHLHNQYDAKDGLVGSSTVGWDFTAGKSMTLPDLGNYATGGVAGATLAPVVEQTYYARFVDAKGAPIASDGSGGWIKLSSASVDLGSNGFSPAYSSVGLTFGDDRAAQALNTAFLNGYTNLGVEIDAFAGTRLVDQSLFAHVGLQQFDVGNGMTTVQLTDVQAQTTHYAYDAKGSPHTTTFGWDFANSAATTLTSAGAYVLGSPAGGSTAAISWYVRLVDENGRTIATDGGARFNHVGDVTFSNNPTFGTNVNVQTGSDQTILAAYESALASHPLARLEVEGYALDGKGVLHIVDEYLLDHVQAYGVIDTGPTLGGYMNFSSDLAQLAHYSYLGGTQVDVWGWDYTLDHAVLLSAPHADVFS